MTTTIELQEELHSNIRRTRVTYRGLVNGKSTAIKCYRRPFFGLIHWLRALYRGKKIRRAGGPVPPIVFAGWVASEKCFGYGTEFLENHRPVRAALRDEPEHGRRLEIVRALGTTIAAVHRNGIEQPDGNLTNFLIDINDKIAMVDEDDIRVFPGVLPIKLAIINLANIAARLSDHSLREELLRAYLSQALTENRKGWNHPEFWKHVEFWEQMFEEKRIQKNISPDREFD